MFKNQHYLSKFYLKGFTKKYVFNKVKSYNLWIYNKTENRLILKQPDNTCVKSYFYSKINEDGSYNHQLEKELSKIEDKVKIVIDKILKNIYRLIESKDLRLISITSKDIDYLIEFVVWQIKRIPLYFDSIDGQYFKFKEKMKEELNRILSNTNSEEIIDEVLDFNSFKNSKIDLIQNLGTESNMNFYEAIRNKNIIIYYITNNESSFITTDNPVIRINYEQKDKNGIGIPSTCIFFPLHKRCCLFLYGLGNSFGFHSLLRSEDINYINDLIANSFYNIIISRDKELINNLIKKMNITLPPENCV